MPADPIQALLRGLPAEVEVQAQERGLWAPIGSGHLASPGPRILAFRGQLEAIQAGEAAFTLALTGPKAARLDINADRDDDARWRRYGEGLVVHATLGGRAGQATFTPGGGGLYLDLSGAIRAQLWLGPG